MMKMMKNKINYAVDFLKSYRVKDWIHYLGYVLLGSSICKNFSLSIFLLASLMLAYAYSFNEYFDKKLKRKFFVLPLLFSFLFLPFLNSLQLLIYFSFILLVTFYSLPLTYLEGKPILSTLSNSIGFLLIFLLPFTTLKKIIEFSNFLLLLFLLNSAAQIIHEIVDYRKDKKIGKNTTAVILGIKNSIFLLRVTLLLTAITSLFLFFSLKIVSISSFLFSSFFFLLSYKKIDNRFRRKFKHLGIVCGTFFLFQFISL